MFITLNPQTKPIGLNRNINTPYFNRNMGFDSVELSFKRKKKDLDKQLQIATQQNDTEALNRIMREKMRKDIIKLGYKDNDVAKVINSPKAYKKLNEYMQTNGDNRFYRPMNLGEAFSVVSNELTPEQTTTYLKIQDINTKDKTPFARVLKQKEVINISKHIQIEDIPRYLELTDNERNGEPFLYNRLEPQKAFNAIYYNFNDEQADTYSKILNTNFDLFYDNLNNFYTDNIIINFVNKEKNYKQFLNLTSEDVTEKLSRPLGNEEAVAVITYGFDDKQIQTFIDYMDANDEETQTSTMFTRPIHFMEAMEAINNNYDEKQTQTLLDMIDSIDYKKIFWGHYIKTKVAKEMSALINIGCGVEQAKEYNTIKTTDYYTRSEQIIEVFKDKEKYTRFKTLQQENNNITKKPLNMINAFEATLRNFNDEKTQLFEYLIRPENELKHLLILEILEDEEKSKRLIDFENNAIKKYGREYSAKEVLYCIDNDLTDEEIREITPEQIDFLIKNQSEINYKQMKKAHRTIKPEKLQGLDHKDLLVAYRFVDIYNKEDINEITTIKKKKLLKTLITSNASLFQTPDRSNKIYELFPLLPKNNEEYCDLVRSIVVSMGIETNEVSPTQEKEFHYATTSLGKNLANLSDKDFNDLKIKQEYSKNEFILDIYNLIKDLNNNERQKVYDYFGFELIPNKNGIVVNEKDSRYSISGYPANLNNGKKLKHIHNEQTKQVIEQIRPYVIRFTENNNISCNNKNVETAINEIVKTLPEIRTLIEKTQHKTHDFDIFNHSLKVMQKIVQNPNFDKLNDSDKKILIIASLIHDCTKKEGQTDSMHATESAFDTFYIIQKLHLTKDEEIKLYSLVKQHEWLGDTNKITDEKKQTEKIKSVAYDLHYGNLFELAKIFTEADLKAVKNNDGFFTRYQNDFNKISNQIEIYISELKKTQPLLPVTKLPTASRIKEAITYVNEDYSTNLKGIYQDETGMVIIKFNEVENETWEKIGFPKGSISKGISAKDSKNNDVNTGNIKFFVHGLDYANQLRKFDAFALPDSDALLSVSYTERPESKYRFFRNQGVIINTDANYVHGGGQTDSGSGYCKNIDNFKKKYAYKDGYRYGDRAFISNLIKKHLNLTDKDYQKLVENNKNKPLTEIRPKEYQETIAKAFATIDSHVRHGGRCYNEMYLSNPEIMGVFAYKYNKKNNNEEDIKNMKNFIQKQKDFIKEYALEKDIPFIVFGN